MKTIELQIPEGKKAEWVNGVLTLVDEQVKDNRPVTERIKTFQDALDELGAEHPFIEQYVQISEAYRGEDSIKDVVAYLKLRIIAAALNEGWQPQFTKDEWRYFPYFYLYTQDEIDEMDEEEKVRVIYRGCYNAYANVGVSFANANNDASYAYADIGSRLAFKTRELAKYAGKQFIDIWADYVFKAE